MPEIADNGAELDALAAMEPEEQKRAVDAVREGKAKSVRGASTRPPSAPKPSMKPTPEPPSRDELAAALLERAEHLRARKNFYEAAHPETKQHVAGAHASNATQGNAHASANPAFASDAAEKTRLSRRAVEVSVHRAEAISPEVKEAIADMPEIADKGVDLDALAAMEPEEQKRAVDAVREGKAKSVRGASTRPPSAPKPSMKPTPEPPSRDELAAALLERAEHLRARKNFYEAAHPETKQHVAGAHASNATQGNAHASANPAFASDAAEKTRLSRRAVEVSVHRAEAISPEVKEAIADMPEIADKGVDLDALAAMEPEEQKRAVDAVREGKSKSVRGASTRPPSAPKPSMKPTPEPPSRDELSARNTSAPARTFTRRRTRRRNSMLRAPTPATRPKATPTQAQILRLRRMQQKKPGCHAARLKCPSIAPKPSAPRSKKPSRTCRRLQIRAWISMRWRPWSRKNRSGQWMPCVRGSRKAYGGRALDHHLRPSPA